MHGYCLTLLNFHILPVDISNNAREIIMNMSKMENNSVYTVSPKNVPLLFFQ